MNRACENCCFYNRLGPTQYSTVDYGECRLNPPNPPKDQNATYCGDYINMALKDGRRFPLVHAEDRCGKYESLESIK